MTQKAGNWRKGWKREGERCERLEALAADLGIADLVEVRNWTDLTLDECKFGQTLEEFTSRVKRMAGRLGKPPDETEATHNHGQYEKDQAPDLTASWKVKDDVTVIVRVLWAEGCKIDPRSRYVEREEQKIHPECAAVLTSLEDL